MNLVSVNADWIKVCEIQNKNKIMMNDNASIKDWMIVVLVKEIISGILVPVIMSMIKHVKLSNK